MIEELIEWARLDCLPVAQRMGLRREAAALTVRHRRLRAHWASHLQETRTAMLASARQALAAPAPPRTAFLMGAGQLRDVPLDALVPLFERIDLVDICFGPAARAAARRYPDRVRCVMKDVSGVLDQPLADPYGAVFQPPGKAWCASVNLLSQLPLAPCAAQLARGMDEQDVERYGRAIQDAHIAALNKADHAFLVIEYAQTTEGRPDEVLVPGLPEHLASSGWRAGKTWHWPLHPPGERATVSGRIMQSWTR